MPKMGQMNMGGIVILVPDDADLGAQDLASALTRAADLVREDARHPVFDEKLGEGLVGRSIIGVEGDGCYDTRLHFDDGSYLLIEEHGHDSYEFKLKPAPVQVQVVVEVSTQ